MLTAPMWPCPLLQAPSEWCRGLMETLGAALGKGRDIPWDKAGGPDPRQNGEAGEASAVG